MFTPGHEDLEERLKAWVAEGSGINYDHVLSGKQNFPAPNVIYSTVLLITPATIGTPSRRWIEESGVYKYETVASVKDIYSVQFFRKGSRDAARRFAVWAYSPDARDSARAKAFTFHTIRNQREMGAIVSAEWEERFGLDLTIGYTQRYVADREAQSAITIAIGDGVHSERLEIDP